MGPGIGGAIGMAAHPRVHRAMVHAGAATDAAQGIQQLIVLVDRRAAVIHQHQVNFLGAVQLVRPCAGRKSY